MSNKSKLVELIRTYVENVFLCARLGFDLEDFPQIQAQKAELDAFIADLNMDPVLETWESACRRHNQKWNWEDATEAEWRMLAQKCGITPQIIERESDHVES